MADVPRDLPYTVAESTQTVELRFQDGSSQLAVYVDGISRYAPSAMRSKREDGTPFIDHAPMQEELYDMGARSAHATHWASSDQIPHVLVRTQKIDTEETIDPDGQTVNVEAELLIKRLVRVSGCAGAKTQNACRAYMDIEGMLYFIYD